MENGYLQGKEMARYVQCHVIDIIAVYKIMEGVLHCQVLMWEVTPKGIELASQFHPCFEVAGQVTSIDIHGQYAAVGSAVVQLVNLTDFALNKRILVQKSMKSTMVLK